jgi:hypothetical protein
MSGVGERVKRRWENILNVLPTNPAEGKTDEEIAAETGDSMVHVIMDLKYLRAIGKIECDDSRIPFKWYKVVK